jgi:hypothetical protein
MRTLLCILLASAAALAAAQSRRDDARETIQPTQPARPPKQPAKPPPDERGAAAKPSVFSAPFRSIPSDALHGKIRHVQEMLIDIDGAKLFLSPGAQIRDARNALILPISLPGAQSAPADAKYQRDGMGNVHRVWLLSEREIGALPPPPYPK